MSHHLSIFALPVLLLQAAEALPAPAAQRTLRLDEAVQIAKKRQPSVLQARAATRAAEARTDQARSGLFPQVTATAQYQKAHGASALRASTPTTSGAGAGGSTAAATSSTGTFDFFSVGANATQLIWDFGQTWERTRAADANADATRMGERTAELQVVLNVRRAYFNARAQKALVRVAEETLANQEKHLGQVGGFVSVGTRPEIDLAQSKSDVATTRVALINAQNGYLIAKSQLAAAMGITTGADFEVTEDDVPPVAGEEQPIDALVAPAIAARPELAQLERQRDAQGLTIKSLKGGYGPTLSALAGASESGPALDNLGTNWNIGAAITWPIFQGGLTKGQVHEAEANLDSLGAQAEAFRLQVRLDVEQAVLSVRAAKAGIDASNDALVNARERLRLAEGRYESGVGTIIELGDAQVAVASAAAQVIQAEFNLSSARAQLSTALGKP
jgi:outer membrane protein